MPLIPAPEKWRREDQEFEASLCYIRLSPKKKKKKLMK
jgi:hypothetical protein